MLGGTELDFAYTPFIDGNGSSSLDMAYQELLASDSQPSFKSSKPPQIHTQQLKTQQIQQQTQQVQQKPPIDALPADHPINVHLQPQKVVTMSKPVQPSFDTSSFNKQFETQMANQRRLHQQQQQASIAAAYYQNQQPQNISGFQYYEDNSYWRKLVSKKKELWKFAQSAFIILFAISIHYVIDFLLRHWLEHHEISFEREVMLRLLYPVSVMFIAWNIIANIK